MAKLRINIKKMLLIMASTVVVMPIYAKGWENVRTEQTPESKVVIKDTEVEVRAARGMIVITTNHAIQVKIYSILGQLVTQDTLQGGTYRLPLNTHGVYLVKIGEITCKVAV